MKIITSQEFYNSQHFRHWIIDDNLLDIPWIISNRAKFQSLIYLVIKGLAMEFYQKKTVVKIHQYIELTSEISSVISVVLVGYNRRKRTKFGMQVNGQICKLNKLSASNEKVMRFSLTAAGINYHKHEGVGCLKM